MAGLLEDLLSTLNSAQTPWAQEAMRRMLAGEDVAGADQSVAARTARKPAPVPREAPPPSADVRNPGQSADPFQAGPATIARTVTEALGERPPVTAGSVPGVPAPQAPQAEPALPAPVKTVRSGSADLADERWMRPAPANDRPDFSQGVAPLAKFLGLDALGLDGGQRARVQQLTYDTLIGKGLDPKTAELVARQPELLRAMLPGLTGDKTQVINNRLIDKRTGRVLADYSDTARQGPEVKEIDGPYGQKIKVQWDAKAQQYVPLRIGGEPAAQPAPGPAAVAPPVAPVAAPEAPQTAPQPAPEPAAQPAPAAPRTQGEFRIGPAVPKAPDGYVHRLSQDGTGYLYTAQGQPVFEAKEGVDARAKALDKDREKAVGAIDTIRRVQELRQLLDKPLGFDKPYQTRAGVTFNTVGDVVGPWAKPEGAPASGGIPGQVISSITNLPAYALQFVRNVKGQYDPEVATINRARNEVDTALTSLQAARVKELFGSSQLSDADREAAAKTVGSLTAQDALALKKQMEVGERDSFNNLKRGLDLGLIKVDDIPPEILTRGVQLGIFRGRGR